MTIVPRLVAAVCVALAATLPAQGKITWAKEFHAALAKAKKENKLLVACISMKGVDQFDGVTRARRVRLAVDGGHPRPRGGLTADESGHEKPVD